MNLHEKAAEIVSQLTLSEKAALCSGKNFWYLKGIDRFDLPSIMVTDGPHGLRKQLTSADNLGINESVPAVCFPTAAATASSFDRDLAREIGKTIAEECRQEEVAVILGPGMNIKRSPLCGRNFEYFSEDPIVSGEIGAALIEGVQSENVGVSMKHYAVNNQEKRRMTSESVLDERTFREIYLKGFEIAVKKSKPWTVMCSYNRLFGEFASQSKFLLTDILRKEWGFEGLVVTDWGAVVDRVKGIQAGLDLEMPFVSPINEQRVAAAVENGALDPALLDESAVHVVELILRSKERQPYKYDAEKHHAVARNAAAQSAILLKNDVDILPITKNATAAIIGAFAKTPRYQGTGSSKINPIKLDNPLEELTALGLNTEYAAGYPLETDEIDPSLIQEACKVAEGKDVVLLFTGLPDRYESESFDRKNMSMPDNHVKLIEAVSQVNPHVVVILQGGSPMELPWADKVQAILMMYLGGEACGGASADLLLGVVNPSGRLAESWPIFLSDNPTYEYFPGYPLTVEYREGPFVGYRYYDTARKPVRYPFGFGLSYTSFEYSDLKVSSKKLFENESLTIACKIRNTGKRTGKEVVQLYVAKKSSPIIRAEQELKGFTKVSLDSGESTMVEFTLSASDLAYYNLAQASWQVESGEYEIRVSASSRDHRLLETIVVTGSANLQLPDMHTVAPAYYDLSSGINVPDVQFEALLGRPIPARDRQKNWPHTINSTFTDIKDKWLGRLILSIMSKQIDKMAGDSPDMKLMIENMLMDMPLRLLAMQGGDKGGFNLVQIEGLVDMLNGKTFKGLSKLLNKSSK